MTAYSHAVMTTVKDNLIQPFQENYFLSLTSATENKKKQKKHKNNKKTEI